MLGKIELAWQERAKTLRAAIRLKHSIAADNEINQRLTAERDRFYKAVQHGRLLSPLSIAQVVNE